MQTVVTPNPVPCKICGASTRFSTEDFGQELRCRVECINSHVATNYCGTCHRAICLWNNRNKEEN